MILEHIVLETDDENSSIKKWHGINSNIGSYEDIDANTFTTTGIYRWRNNITNGINWSIVFVLKGSNSSDIIQFCIYLNSTKSFAKRIYDNNTGWSNWIEI